MDKTAIADRMKNNYEKRYKMLLTRRTPVIMRLDGRAFHSLTKGMKKPFSEKLNTCMRKTAQALMEEIQGAKCAYVQSDEISILITDFDRFTTNAWFDYDIQKMVLVSSAIATAKFNETYFKIFEYYRIAQFDSRVFNIPIEEVNNYFVWRQQDWLRNSIQLAGQSIFSHIQLHQKNTMDVKDMLYEEGIVWEDYDDKWKNGSFIKKGKEGFDNFCPIFKENPEIINSLMEREEK